MSIIRSPRKASNFTIIANSVCCDPRLSMRALGLLVRLLSRPDNWRTNSESLAREFGVGKDQIRSVLAELTETGYMVLEKGQNDSGQWMSNWIVFDEAENYRPEPENRVLGNPVSGSLGAITRTDETSTDNNTLHEQRAVYKVKRIENPFFEQFWKAYPRKTNKGFARGVFTRLKVNQELLNTMLKALAVQVPQWKDPQYIPHPSTWLNGERWLDEPQFKTVYNNHGEI